MLEVLNRRRGTRLQGSQQVEDKCGMWADAEDDDDNATEENGPDYGPPSTSGKLSLMS